MKTEYREIISSFDGLKLELLYKIPEQKKGLFILSHGMAEHKERYLPFMEYLSERGYVTVIHDHRGHGVSILEKGDHGYFYEETGEAIVEDLHEVILKAKEEFPDLPVILFGHSMGSMVVRKYIKKYDDTIDRLIVCGSPSYNPLCHVALILIDVMKHLKGDRYRSPLLQKLAFGMFNKGIEGASDNRWLSYDEENVKAFDAHELDGFIFTLNGFQNLFTLMKDIYSSKGWKCLCPSLPILFLAGEEDPVIVSKKKWYQSQDFLRSVGYTNISSHLYPKMRHEILNETKRFEVYEDIKKWIE